MTTVSIVTIVKDDAQGLQRTYSSVRTQNALNWEMLIVVGASTDNSAELADEFSNENDSVKVIRQESRGIFSAMNEGLNYASGEFIWFMNSGDIFAGPEVLGLACNEIAKSSLGLVVGGYQFRRNAIVSKYTFRRKKITPLSFAFSRRGGCHQAMIFRTSYVKGIGGFNLKYKANSDFLLALSIIKMGGGQRVSEIYADIEPGGFADQNIFMVHKEKHELRKSFFSSKWVNLLSNCWTYAARCKILSRRLIQGRWAK